MNTHDVRMQDAHAHAPSHAATKSPAGSVHTPLNSSLIDRLDPAFVKLYNEYIGSGPPWPTDINLVRQNYSALYSYATAPPSGVGGIGETTVPGWEKYPGEVNVRVYVPPGEETGQRKVWPVHFNFHGGGMSLWSCVVKSGD
jgi:acetyl esterase/lipase